MATAAADTTALGSALSAAPSNNPDLLFIYFERIEALPEYKLGKLLRNLGLPEDYWKELESRYDFIFELCLEISPFNLKKYLQITFTWKDFLTALVSVNENELAEELNYLLSIPMTLQKSDYESTILNIKKLPEEFFISHYFLSQSDNWCPLIFVRECKEKITFHVIIDVSLWKIKPDDFHLSIKSPEINEGKELYGKFERYYQQDDCRYIFKCQLPIPAIFLLQKNLFRYKYVIISNDELKEEDLAMYNSEWRTLKAGINRNLQFDTEMRPPQEKTWWFTKKSISNDEIAANALSVYMEWAFVGKRLAYVCLDEADIELQIKQKACFLAQVINAIKIQRYCHREVISHVHEEILKFACSFLKKADSSLERLLSFLIIITAFVQIGILTKRTHIASEIITPIPPSDLNQSIIIFSQLSSEFKKFVFLPFVAQLSKRLSSVNLILLLPLLHGINLHHFIPGQPYNLPSDEVEMKKILFCGLEKKDYYSYDDLYYFPDPRLKSMQPYFEIDWLMPRVHLALCSFSEIMYFVRNSPDMVFFACWEIGAKELKYKDMKKMIPELLELLIEQKLIQKEEYKICLSGIVKIITKLVNFGCQLSLFQSAIRSFLHVANAHLTHNMEHATQCFEELSYRILEYEKLSDYIISDKIKEWNDILSLNKFDSTKELWIESICSRFCDQLEKIDLQSKLDAIAKGYLKDELFLIVLNSILKSLPNNEHYYETMWEIIDEKAGPLENVHILHGISVHYAKAAQNSLSDFCIKTINNTGFFSITVTPGNILHSTEEMVILMIDCNGKNKVFKFADLKNLQSKLMLVATENKDVMEFIEILSVIEKTAVLLIKLQEAGLAHYTHFQLKCACNEYKRVKPVIKFMEKALFKWRESMCPMCMQYPYLNYYTCQQLLDLKREFGSLKEELKKEPQANPSQKLIKLLLIVVSSPHPSLIRNALDVDETHDKHKRNLEEECTKVIDNIMQSDSFFVQMNVPKGEYLSIAELGEVLNALATAAVKKEDSLDAEKTIG